MKKYWFKAKDYGWGWYPSSWQGWVVILIWAAAFTVVFVGINSLALPPQDLLVYFLPRVIVLTVVLFAVCWKTGERPEWRWAGRPTAPLFVVGWTFGLLAVFIALAFALQALFRHI